MKKAYIDPVMLRYVFVVLAIAYIANAYALSEDPLSPLDPIIDPFFPPSDLLVGWRASSYGYMYQENPDYWVNVANQMSEKFPGSTPAGIWIVGIDWSDGTCGLTFPNPGEPYQNIAFDYTDMNERYLDAYDYNDMAIWLQVEPADASVDDLINVILNQYKHHKSIYGFGVDVEWLNSEGYPGGRPVTDAEAERWLKLVKSHNPRYKLFLKHWESGYMPPTYRHDDLVFISDSLDVANMNLLINDFEYDWSDNFPGSEVGYQIGYDLDYQNDGGNDKDWWGSMNDPMKEIGNEILDRIPNTGGIYWVDFSIKQQFPGY